jgi:hypothetical protein
VPSGNTISVICENLYRYFQYRYSVLGMGIRIRWDLDFFTGSENMGQIQLQSQLGSSKKNIFVEDFHKNNFLALQLNNSTTTGSGFYPSSDRIRSKRTASANNDFVITFLTVVVAIQMYRYFMNQFLKLFV